MALVRVESRTRARVPVAAAALCLAAGLPFLDQPFHVDDPNFLALARHASPHPLELYAFRINWLGTDERAFDVLANPPLVPWYLALLSRVAGDREWVYHLGFLPFMALALLGAWRLGRRFATDLPEPTIRPPPPGKVSVAAGPTGRSAPAALWTMLWVGVAPALVVSSHTVMPDLPLVGFYALGVALAIEGMDRGQPARALAGASVAGLSALCRYSGMTVVPLLGLYVVLHRPRAVAAALALAAAAAPLAAWSLASFAIYGRVHWLAMAGFEGQTLEAAAVAHKLVYQLAALGLAVAPAGLLATVMTRGIRLADPLASTTGGRFQPVALLSGASMGALGSALLTWWAGLPGSATFLLLMAGLAGGAALVAGAMEALAALGKGQLYGGRGGAGTDGLFLAAWLIGVLIFNLWLRFASVRYLLPALPPSILLLQRVLPNPDGPAVRYGAATLLVLALSLALSGADRQFAEGYRSYVAGLPPPARTRWFVGHWGLQHYLERAGARALNSDDRKAPHVGDEIVAPVYAWPQDVPEGVQLRLTDRTELPARPGLRTFTVEGRGCFYASLLAPGPTAVWLPFGFSSAPLETLTRWEVVETGAERR